MDTSTSPEIGLIAEAIAKAQAEIENIDKTGLNPAFRAKYVKLGDVLDEVRPKFAKHGIAIIQNAINGEGSNVGVATLFAHSSGQWIESRLFVAPAKFDAQGAGSAITYCRRYALMAMAGVAPDDDDGNAAVAKPEPRQRTEDARQPFDREPAQANGATDPAHAQRVKDANAAKGRIRLAIENAKTPKLIDEIIEVNSHDLAMIKDLHGPTYDALMALAAGRKTEILGATG